MIFALSPQVRDTVPTWHPLPVQCCCTTGIGERKIEGIAQYDKAMCALSPSAVEAVKRTYGSKIFAYLSRLQDRALCRAYAVLRDFMKTSQGGESQLSASFRNQIRSAEPHSMLQTVLESQRYIILKTTELGSKLWRTSSFTH